ncbi:hypothetical protein F2Q70_00042819 [Brassica cretica]|uniref:Uncharacterized protein n=1 Tax=Brassica cretica TaxID=69181 RepID=A0A8S9KND9_BRACR|nr:hypothetical protein F2Q70_00042819 [Brassica cretica]KAF3518779.1 hypothetical protein DY000_02059380 [Brassica cretica]
MWSFLDPTLESHSNVELWYLYWAVDSMKSTRQRNVIFESSFALAREVFLNPNGFPELTKCHERQPN